MITEQALSFTSLPLLLILLCFTVVCLSKVYLILTEMSKDETLIFLGNPSPISLTINHLAFLFPFSLLVLLSLFLRNEVILYYLVFSPHKDTSYHSVRPNPNSSSAAELKQQKHVKPCGSLGAAKLKCKPLSMFTFKLLSIKLFFFFFSQ